MTTSPANVRRLPADCCELGEGPHYDGDDDIAWWFDIRGRMLYEHRFAAGITRGHVLPRMASVIARIDAERQLVVCDDGIYVRSRADGGLERLVGLEAERPTNRSNDGRVHPSGRLWVGTMGIKAEPGAGTIYWSDGRVVRPLFKGITVPNSIAFTADGATAYFADTRQETVWRIAVDPATALPRGEPEVFLSSDRLPNGGGFDGSVVDADGVLWNAAWRGASVTGFAPDGNLVATFALPARKTTCPCFVGPRLSSLLVTSAWEGDTAAERAADPGGGFTYVIEGGFRGQPDPAFRLDAGA